MMPTLSRADIHCIILSAVLAISHLAGPLQIDQAIAAKPKKPQATVVIETDKDKLPVQVAEMHEAILAAAQSGRLKELLVPIQWNELRPDFGKIDASNPIPAFKKLSVDGDGKEILAILTKLLQMPYAVIRQGRDIENNKIYVWPYLAELPLKKLKPEQDVQLLQIVPRAVYKSMKQSGKYTYWRLAIGADGTWHEFLKPE
ncbi:MAG: hypothetical protein AAGB04_25285 [Pseudomonadota bacterium]